jgi:hypothetical protein
MAYCIILGRSLHLTFTICHFLMANTYAATGDYPDPSHQLPDPRRRRSPIPATYATYRRAALRHCVALFPSRGRKG